MLPFAVLQVLTQGSGCSSKAGVVKKKKNAVKRGKYLPAESQRFIGGHRAYEWDWHG